MLGRYVKSYYNGLLVRKFSSVLIANRGEIAIRIAQAASDSGLKTIGVCSMDDNKSLHCFRMDTTVQLAGIGAAAYLDMKELIEVAKSHGCSYLHPGYGFLSENAIFADMCARNDIKFIGPSAEQLRAFGDKSRAREIAVQCNVPVVPGISSDTDIAQASAFFKALPEGAGMIIKARSGGGGRGMRVVDCYDDIPRLIETCKREAKQAFGDDAVYVEQFLGRVRHIEVQVIGDGNDVCHLWERECSLQRSQQKVVEVAPSPSLQQSMRERLLSDALRMAKHVKFIGVGTFEFLVDSSSSRYFFMEANPRLQVEHTVTEAISGVDLVQTQLDLAKGMSLQSMGLMDKAGEDVSLLPPKGFAMQARVNMEALSAGIFRPTGGLLSVFEPPLGKGIRVDASAYAGYETSSRYDSLLAKLIVQTPSSGYSDCVGKMLRSLKEFRVEGVTTNIPFLIQLLSRTDVLQNDVHTASIQDWVSSGDFRETPKNATLPHEEQFFSSSQREESSSNLSSTPVDKINMEGLDCVGAPMQGTLISVDVREGSHVCAGQQLALMEAMKMEHVILAPQAGIIRQVLCETGTSVREGMSLFFFEPSSDGNDVELSAAPEVDLDYIRPDLQEVLNRHALRDDASRVESTLKRHKLGRRTARENLMDLVDPDSFSEYGGLAIAAQRRRRSLDDLINNTPADGMVCGVGTVNADMFAQSPSCMRTSCVVVSYDYMVLAGTQGVQNHRKKDRMFELAESMKLPVILFAEGGGGRPGDTDTYNIAGLDCLAFTLYAKLSGLVPRVGIASGRCFAGNAALLGVSDVIIATPDANIGMAGPAMIEGGGLGVYRPEDIGPVNVQTKNGVIDLMAQDDADAIRLAKQYLSYFQGSLEKWEIADQRILRSSIPSNRLRIYDVFRILRTVVDEGSLLTLRDSFGKGMVTALGRVEGKSVGIIANNPSYLSGAIDSDGADKASRFMKLCDAFDIPIVSFCDTPGIMVGPEAESTALVRHAARMFVTSASITVPLFTIVLRKGYGLGAQAMAGGSFKNPVFTVAWPTGEFGGMGLEGAVKLGFKKELDAIEDADEKKRVFEAKVDALYQNGKAVNYATAFEIDNVIDPASTRKWIAQGLRSIPSIPSERGKKRNLVDTW